MKKIIFFLLVLFCSCNKEKTKETPKEIPKEIPKEASYFKQIKSNDVKLAEPVYGDWLFSHKEKGQSFEQYFRSKHVCPTAEANIIYLQPIGNFNALQKKQIQLTNEYLEIYFQLKTKTLKPISNDVVPNSSRRMIAEGHEQLLAGYLLNDVLKEIKPLNRIALMGLSELDLYPKPEWNYVFGLASYHDKVGVSSIYRLQDGELTAENFNLCLSRLLKISSHEIGHMFGLHHCTTANCVMNGTNNMGETDRHSIRLCSVCQRKLNSCIPYDNKKRLTDLEIYFKKNDLIEGFESMKKDIEVVQ
ncbi:Zn-dependent protease [Flavobacterium hibernum]|uniref:Zn-dependent protease n=1 Tax=Flavobacterium hibernum TaxID=37752 RepID=A0A0D0EW35_9FLAO|nr:Zn-dependent protease [Flavobacterium hibernum]KIO51251.1 Zn-dependent protease [Flavobacterium hibernum]OXA85137.1 Zn-dependent protease [Flavobacterium hibernum]STO19508.1 archaemetzincin-like protein [Flavobacterium hibernum]